MKTGVRTVVIVFGWISALCMAEETTLPALYDTLLCNCEADGGYVHCTVRTKEKTKRFAKRISYLTADKACYEAVLREKSMLHPDSNASYYYYLTYGKKEGKVENDAMFFATRCLQFEGHVYSQRYFAKNEIPQSIKTMIETDSPVSAVLEKAGLSDSATEYSLQMFFIHFDTLYALSVTDIETGESFRGAFLCVLFKTGGEKPDIIKVFNEKDKKIFIDRIADLDFDRKLEITLREMTRSKSTTVMAVLGNKGITARRIVYTLEEGSLPSWPSRCDKMLLKRK
jgi:hypothetical protein